MSGSNQSAISLRIKLRLKVGEAGPLNWVEGKLKPVHNLLVKRLQPGD